MKTFFDKSLQEQLRQRAEKLTANSGSQWGKMTAAQMLSHVTAAMQVAVGDFSMNKHPLRFLGSIFKTSLLGEKPFRRNTSTTRELVRNQDCDFDVEKERFIAAFNKIAQGPSTITCFYHGFFGKMTADDWGRLIYKHLDHHFQQFGV